MCGLFELKAKAKVLSRHFRHLQLSQRQMPHGEEMHPKDFVLMVTGQREGYSASRVRWGLVGSFLTDEPQSPVINLRSEGLDSLPFYGKVLKRNRCLIPATAFFAWQSLPSRDKRKKRISHPAGEALMFAGVFDHHPQAGTTCAILTTSANESVGPVHHRMPLILNREAAAFWLADLPEFPAAEFQMMVEGAAQCTLQVESVIEPEESPQLAFKFA